MPPSRQSLSRLPLPPNVYLILLSLTHGELHGYELRKEVSVRSDGAVQLDPGSLYRLIGRLLDEGLLAELTTAGATDERRRYYRLTAQGRRLLDSETDRLADLVDQARGRRRARQVSR